MAKSTSTANDDYLKSLGEFRKVLGEKTRAESIANIFRSELTTRNHQCFPQRGKLCKP